MPLDFDEILKEKQNSNRSGFQGALDESRGLSSYTPEQIKSPEQGGIAAAKKQIGQEEETGDFMRGLGNYIPQMKDMGNDILTVGGVAAKKMGADDIGQSMIESGIKGSTAAEAEIESKDTDEFTAALDKGVGSVLTEWLPYQAGQAVGMAGEMGLAVGAGALLGGAAGGPAGGAVGGATGLLGKAFLKKGLKEKAAEIAKEHGEEQAQKFLKKESGKRIGKELGIIGMAEFHGMGEVGGRMLDELDKNGKTPDDIDFARFAIASQGHAALERMSDLIAIKSLTTKLDKALEGNFFKAVAGRGLLTGAKEAPVEMGQTLLERYGAALPATDQEAFHEYFNAAAAGFAMGGMMGGAGGGAQALAEKGREDITIKPGTPFSDEEQNAIDAMDSVINDPNAPQEEINNARAAKVEMYKQAEGRVARTGPTKMGSESSLDELSAEMDGLVKWAQYGNQTTVTINGETTSTPPPKENLIPPAESALDETDTKAAPVDQGLPTKQEEESTQEEPDVTPERIVTQEEKKEAQKAQMPHEEEQTEEYEVEHYYDEDGNITDEDGNILTDEQIAKVEAEYLAEQKAAKEGLATKGVSSKTKSKLYDENDQEHSVTYQVVEAADLEGTVSKDVNQYRDRERKALQLVVSKIANNPIFEKLADAPVMENGAPVVASDGKIVAGNGRFMGIRKAYGQGTNQSYTEGLVARAGSLGIDPAALQGMQQPVLIRRLEDGADVRNLAVLSNEGGAAPMSALEQSTVDAERIGGLPADLETTAEGKLTQSAREGLAKRLIAKMPQNQAGALVDGQGRLSQEGSRRLDNAILNMAYGESSVLTKLTESRSTDMLNLSNALIDAAPAIASMRDSIEAGVQHDADFVPNLIEAVESMSEIRRTKTNIDEFIAQQDAFDQLPPETESILRFFEANVRKAKVMKSFMVNYAEMLATYGDPNQQGMFEQEAPTVGEVIDRAKTKQDETAENAEVSGQPEGESRKGDTDGTSDQEDDGATEEEVDLLGDDTRAAQALADKEKELDDKRSGKGEEQPALVQGGDELFANGGTLEPDLFDAAKDRAAASEAPEHAANTGRPLDLENVYQPFDDGPVKDEAYIDEELFPGELLDKKQFKEVTNEFAVLFDDPKNKTITEKRIDPATIKKSPGLTKVDDNTWEIPASPESVAVLKENGQKIPKAGAKVTIKKTKDGYTVKSNYNNRYDTVGKIRIGDIIQNKDIKFKFRKTRDAGGNIKFLNDEEAVAAGKKPGQVKVFAEEEAKALWLEIDTAILTHDTWVEDAITQAENDDLRRENSKKTILSLFDLSGKWAQPWADAGYNVITMDIQEGFDVAEINAQFLYDDLGLDGDVYGILAACPCTDFAVAGARHFKEKDADGRTEASKDLVFHTMRIIEELRPQVWVLENPVSRIQKLTGLPDPRMTFDPWNFGHAYTKKTVLWGNFNTDLPLSPVDPVLGSKMHSKYGGKSLETKNKRSETPDGFAYAFFAANNFEAMPVIDRLTHEFPEASGAIEAALDAGITEARIRELMEDTYENYDYQEAREALLMEVASKLPLGSKERKKALANGKKKAAAKEAKYAAEAAKGKRIAKEREEASGRQAKAGGERGLNGEWYKGGQFMPSSAFTIKGKYKVSKTKGTGRVLIEPGLYGFTPDGMNSLFSSVAQFVQNKADPDAALDKDSKLQPTQWMVDDSDFPWEAHFNGGLDELKAKVKAYNEGQRYYDENSTFGKGETGVKESAGLFEVNDGNIIPLAYMSGMSRPSDFKAAVKGGAGIGVEATELSAPMINLVATTAASGKEVFVDSGAFRTFKASMKKGSQEQLDFDKVFDVYNKISDKMMEKSTKQEDNASLMLVMPDVIGSQAQTLELIEANKDKINHLYNRGHEIIIPFQKGELSQADAYKKVTEILDLYHPNFVVGIPSNAEAISDSDVVNLLEYAEPMRIHILGAVKNKSFERRMAAIRNVTENVPGVTADANILRSKLDEVVGLPQEKRQQYVSKLGNESVPEAWRNKIEAAAQGYEANLNDANILGEALANYFGDKSFEKAYKEVELPVGLDRTRAAFERGFQKRIVLVSGKGKHSFFRGVRIPENPDVLYINEESDVDLPLVAGHELYHDLKANRPELHKWLVSKLADHVQNFPEYVAKLDALLQPGEQPHTIGIAQEELLADFTGDALTDKTFLESLAADNPLKFKQLLNSIIKWLGKIRKNLGSDKYVADVDTMRGYLREALNAYATESNLDAVTEGRPKFMVAYHGTPHDVDKFTTEKIGTGEGAQAYGWGLYFASNRDVAEFYRKMRVDKNRLKDAAGYAIPRSLASILNIHNFDIDKTRKAINRTISSFKDGTHGHKQWKRFLSDLDKVESNGGLDKRQIGNLYEVELSPKQDEYLLWDESLSGQSEKVKKALENLNVAAKKVADMTREELIDVLQNIDPNGVWTDEDSIAEFGEPATREELLQSAEDMEVDQYLTESMFDDKSATGESLYKQITAKYGGGNTWSNDAQRKASEYLHSLGIRGIKYLDGSSRPDNVVNKTLMEIYNKTGNAETAVDEFMRTIHESPKQKEKMRNRFLKKLNSINYNYVIFNDNDVDIQARFSRMGLEVNEDSATYTDERFDDVFREFVYASGRVKASIVTIDPADFLAATTQRNTDQSRIRDKAGKLDAEKLKGEYQTPFLTVVKDGEEFRVDGHEGRHRMAALAKAGIKSVPVVVRHDWSTSKTTESNLDEPQYLLGQHADDVSPRVRQSILDDSGIDIGNTAILNFRNAIDITHDNKKALTEEYTKDAGIRFSRSNASNTAEAQLDMFAPVDAPAETAKTQASDSFDVMYRHAKSGELRSGLDTIKTPEDAAHVVADIRKHAQETMLAIVTDENGKVLNIIRHTKGTKDSSIVIPSELIAAVANTKGSRNVWFAHNHPSGVPTPSQADKRITERLINSLDGMDIMPKGHVVVGEGQRFNFLSVQGDVQVKQITPARRNRSLALTERVLQKRVRKDNTELTTAAWAKSAIKDLESESGILLLDNRHRAIGVLSLSSSEMGRLRDGKQVRRIMSALDTTNAAAGFTFDKGSTDPSRLQNLGNYLARLDEFRHLDAFYAQKNSDELVSFVDKGKNLGYADRPFFSRKEGAPTWGERRQRGDYDALTKEEKAVVDESISEHPDSRKLRGLLRGLKGTNWAKFAIDSAFTRRALKDLIAGKDPQFPSSIDALHIDVQNAMKIRGEEALWARLQDSKISFIGHASKPVNSINSSFLNCRPSKNCANYCYATDGNYRYENVLNKSEMVDMAIKLDPARAAEIAARQYSVSVESVKELALRILDKGELGEHWIPFIKALNNKGVYVQVFSKRPELLALVPEGNVRLLSIDRTNRGLSKKHPEFSVAYVMESSADIANMQEIRAAQKKAGNDHFGVILPIEENFKRGEAKKAVPAEIRKQVCPIIGGHLKIGKDKGQWNCTTCEIKAKSHDVSLGCFPAGGKVDPKMGDIKIEQVYTKDEAEARIRDLLKGLNNEERSFILRNLDAEFSESSASDDRQGKEGSSTPTEAGQGNVRQDGRELRGDATGSKRGKASREDLTPKFSRSPQTETAAFKKWFGDSAAVDADGNPLVAFHATQQDFSVFDPTVANMSEWDAVGSWFETSPEGHDIFLALSGTSKNKDGTYSSRSGGNIMPTYLSIQNPMVIKSDDWMLSRSHPGNKGFEQWLNENKGIESVVDLYDMTDKQQVAIDDEYRAYIDSLGMTAIPVLRDRVSSIESRIYPLQSKRRDTTWTPETIDEMKEIDAQLAVLNHELDEAQQKLDSAEVYDSLKSYSRYFDSIVGADPNIKFGRDRWKKGSAKAFRKHLKDSGYDGVKIENHFGDNSDNPRTWFIALEPGQIKSAVGNAGTFDQDNPDIRFSRKQPVFHSELERQVDAFQQKVAPAPQWIAMIDKLSQNGVKKSEIDWSGVTSWLDEFLPGEKVNKEDILGYLRKHYIAIEFSSNKEAGGPFEVVAEDGYGVESFATLSEAEAEAARLTERYGGEYVVEDIHEGETKYSDYQTVGEAENYREVLIKLPSKDALKVSAVVGFRDENDIDTMLVDMSSEGMEDMDYGRVDMPIYYVVDSMGNQRSMRYIDVADAMNRMGRLQEETKGTSQLEIKEEIQEVIEFTDFDEATWKNIELSLNFNTGYVLHQVETGTRDSYLSPHWKDLNVITHVRMNDRKYGKKKITFIEEIQSDWHQEGRRRGYRHDLINIDDWSMKVIKVNNKEVFVYEHPKSDIKVDLSLGELEWIAGNEDKLLTEEFFPSLLAVVEESNGSIKDAPFKKTDEWAMLGFKKALREAVESGSDIVAWTPGRVQADRYDLSQQVDTVSVEKVGSNFDVTAIKWDEGGTGIGRNLVQEENISIERVEEVVGKDLADKISKQTDRYFDYEGLDLKIGGEGMKGFYDKILPKAVGKFVKKYGGKVATTEIQIDRAMYGVSANGEFLQNTDVRTRSDAQQIIEIRTDADRARGREYVEYKVAKRPAETMDVWGVEITDKMREAASDSMPMFSRMPSMPTMPAMPQFRAITSGIKDRLDGYRFHVQDKLIDLKRKQQSIGAVPDATNAYQKAGIWEGKAAEKMNDFDEVSVQPLLAQMADTGLELSEIGEWLVARHADEANRYLYEINKDMGLDPKRRKLAGMDSAFTRNGRGNPSTAEQILTQHASNAHLQQVGQMIDQINRDRVSMLVSEGLLTQEMADNWQGRYQHYVPLKREEAAQNDLLPSRGQGFSLKGKESKMRTGSAYWTPHLVVTNTLAQMEASIVRAGKNDVGKSLLSLVEQNPDSNFWEIAIDQKQKYVRNGKVVEGPKMWDSPNELTVKRGGKDYVIVFNAENEKAMRLAAGMKNLNAPQLNGIVGAMGKVNRFLSHINTSWNPEFVISNFFRDYQTAGYNLTNTELADESRKVLKNVPKAMAGIRSALLGDGSHGWAQVWDDFRRHGGKTGWIDLHKSLEGKERDLGKMMERLKDGKPALGTVRRIFDRIDDINAIVENGVRLSAYKAAIDKGLTPDAAAALAKDLTVNFNRKGNMGPMMNAMYMFYNASIQGSVRLLQTMAYSKKGRILAAGTVGFAIMLDMLNRSLAGEDDDGENLYDALPDYIKAHNLILMGEKEPIVKIPLPWGYNVLHTAGQAIGESISGNNVNHVDLMAHVGASMVDAFNPVGSGSLLQMVAPTILDPAVQIAENKNFAGIPLKPEQSPFGVPKPLSEQYFSSVTDSSKSVAKWMNEASGGNEFRPGALDISPEWIDMILAYVTGGAGRTVMNSVDTTQRLLKGKPLETGNVPFVRKVTGYNQEHGIKSRYYEWSSDVAYAKKEAKGLKGEERAEAMQRPAASLIGKYNMTEKTLRKLRATRRRMVKNGAPDASIARIDAKIRKLMASFNRSYANRVLKGGS